MQEFPFEIENETSKNSTKEDKPEVCAEKIMNHEALKDQIPWNKSNYIKRQEGEGQIDSFYLLEPFESLKLREEYANQELSSFILAHYNNNEYLKLEYLIDSANKKIPKLFKCMMCSKFEVYGRSVACRMCHDNFHLYCLQNVCHLERGRFFHENAFEKKIYEIYLMNKSIQKTKIKNKNNQNTKLIKSPDREKKEEEVYWACPKCAQKIPIPFQLSFKLEFPFEIQALPNISDHKIYTENVLNKLQGNLLEYVIPKNMDKALNKRNLIFQDDCVYLTNAKVKNNSIIFSKERIDVIVSFILVI